MNNRAVPLVSICIPTFNGEDYIAEAIRSALKQTYPNIELVISDDNSTDGTWEILEDFKSKTKVRIHLYKHTPPKGIGANWNNCVRKAKGQYIKFLFQDDTLEPDCVEKMLALIQSKPNIGLVYSKRKLIYNTLTPKIEEFMKIYGELHTYWGELKLSKGILPGTTYLRDSQLLNAPKNKIGEPTNVLLNSECFKTIGYFSEDLQQALDSDYWYRVMTRYNIGFIDEKLASFRLHEAQASQVNKKRKIPDKKLMERRYYIYLYKYLHPKNKRKLLKRYHPLIKVLAQLKEKYYG